MPIPRSPRPTVNRSADSRTATRAERPLHRGFLLALGAIAAIAFALALYTLRGVAASVLAALFIAVALEPIIRALGRRGWSRPAATAVLTALVVAIGLGIILFAVQALQEQVARLIETVPGGLAGLRDEPWFTTVDELTSGGVTAALAWVVETLLDPQTWIAVSNGVLGFGASVVSGVTGGFFVLILTLYFVITFESVKGFGYSLVPASRRARFVDLADRIIDSVGRYLGGMVVLALLNATFSTIVMLVVGIPGAPLLGIVVFFITIIPLIGTVLTTIGITLLTLATVPSATIPVLIAMLIYMQVEAYVLTPKVMSRAVQVPGSVVLISATAGGSLLGLPGALIGVPVAASIALILREVVVPARQRR
ncbi:AI-2E family transporter [Microcella alkalica]|uniref:AI-2E family transporter n=1 Tax=Microcella alkalica TaxID=355930 RepID=UPI00145F7B3D|nr:AI-2E family transporter [Microcella alkalica]